VLKQTLLGIIISAPASRIGGYGQSLAFSFFDIKLPFSMLLRMSKLGSHQLVKKSDIIRSDSDSRRDFVRF
jgi:hypothetical protein